MKQIMADMKTNSKNAGRAFGILIAAALICCLCGCGSESIQSDNVSNEVAEGAGIQADTVQAVEANPSPTVQDVPQDMQQGGIQDGELDIVLPDAADDEWYKRESVYTDDNGRRLEVFFDDEGMLEFAVDGLSLYYTTVDKFQQENNWKVYTCDDGSIIVYYPGTPAHLEISDGEYAGLYEAGGDKMK